MGRRSEHSAEELREMILTAASDLILTHGLAGISAREIARKIDYSPGTLYNAFRNLDDVILTIQARLLDALDARLADLPLDGDPHADIQRIATAYVAFTHENARLWNLLFEHHLPPGTPVPDWYRSKLDGLMTRLENALKPLMANGGPDVTRRAAGVLWASVHGITSLSTADKLTNVTRETADALVSDLISRYLDGIARRA